MLETLSVATLLMGMKPDMVIAYEGLYELGESSADVINEVVLTGKCDGQVATATVVKMDAGSDSGAIETRKKALQVRLATNKSDYEGLRSNHDNYGAELIDEIVGQIDALVRQIDDVKVGGGDF